MQKISCLRCAVCVGAGLLLFSTAVLAADGSSHLNEQKILGPNYLPSKPNESFQLPPVEPLSAPSSSIDASTKVKLDRVVFRGNTVFPASELEAIAAPYLGRIIGASELEELRQLLTRHYIDHGYVNSGVLLAKDTAADIVVFEVIEGRLTGIRLQGMERLNDNYVIRRLAKGTDGPLNIEVIRERYQMLLSDPLIQRMNGRLMPDIHLGEAILDIDVERARPYQLTASINNHRPPSIGSEQIGLSGWVRNLTGQGDLLEASIYVPAQGKSGSNGSLAWHMPIGYYGTKFSAALSQGRSSVVEEPMRILNIKSTMDSRDIGLSQSLIETLAQNLAVGLNLVSRENRTWLLDTPFSFSPGEPNGVTKEELWRFWQEYTRRSNVQVLALRSTFNYGKNNLHAIAGLPPTNIPEQKYHIWLGQAQYARHVLENGAQIIFRGALQRTRNRLSPLDGMSIGGVDTVRGYRENQLIRDNGETFSVEFEYPLTRNSTSDLNVVVIPFYDHGRGQNNGDFAATISSCGLASRARWQGLNLDIAIAKRLVFPEAIKGSGATLQDQGFHFQLSYSY